MENTVTMSFDNGRNRVRIQKSTLDALGNPRHIVMLYSKNERMIILQPVTCALPATAYRKKRRKTE